ncbi:hypothetical protein TWF696_000634 [Orbilia brochopaga]|uniref:Uncharacterized protein n=1 Tax=Orbilia brochopaga TaxID=3140254 RepID=A0AAV9VEI7_9PEZI
MRYRIRWVLLAGVLSIYGILWKFAPLEFDERDAPFFPPYPGSEDYVSVPRMVVSFGDAWSAVPASKSDCRRDSRAPSLLHQLSRAGVSWFHHEVAVPQPDNTPQPPAADSKASSVPLNKLSPALTAQLWTEFEKTIVQKPDAYGSPRYEDDDDSNEYVESDTECLYPPQTWNERLCYDYVSCINLKSFAPAGRLVGVDHSDPAYTSIQSLGSAKDTGTANDLVAQVEEWLQFAENDRRAAAETARANNETDSGWEYDYSTLFTVWLGMGEVLKYSLLPHDDAVEAVDRSLDILFMLLYHLATSVSSPAILLPHVVDVTTLPAFHEQILRTSSPAGISPYLSTQILKNANFLRRYWNQGLEMRAQRFNAGQIITWDVDDWFAAEIRQAGAWKDDSGMRKGEGVGGLGRKTLQKGTNDIDVGGFAEVEKPCVTDAVDGMKMCQDQDKHLMWDNIHLGAKAHERLARAAADLVIELWLTEDSYLHPPTRTDRWTLFKGMGLSERQKST